MDDHATPTLTIVVGTTQAWPESEMCLDALHPQAVEIGAEVIVATADGAALPADAVERYPAVRSLVLPGAAIFRLRARALEHARGAIVAVTEDHCRVGRNWCRRILEAHDRHPEAAAIGGAVENGADGTRIDEASFLLVNGAVLPPLPPDGNGRIALQANVSYKRCLLPERFPADGQLEWMFHRDLRRRGETLRSEDAIRVVHVQSLGVRATCRIHFDDGRTIAAFRLPEIGWVERAARFVGTPLMPLALLARAVRPHLRHPARRAMVVRALPWLAVLVCLRSLGCAVGLVAGAGTSPHRIR